ncbi:MAG TPA: chitin deacetylase, partial [Rhodospirillales bacterium]|nr:chitin deacetylase [Rhodospirillales bacterium]
MARFVLLLMLGMTIFSAAALAANSAVIFMYHRFGEGNYPSTSITLDQFQAHITELQQGGYTVMAVADIVAALQKGEALPDRAIGITIDDAYLSAFSQAWPRLKAAGFPLTLFVATDPVDRKTRGYMTWQQIRQLKKEGVTIGSQSASHLHMAASTEQANRRDLEKSKARFRAELGVTPELIAYPYGEAGLAVMTLAEEAGFKAGFGQHSGVVGKYSNMYYLPRFALNEKYGAVDRFRLAANALDLPIGDLTPADPLIDAGDENPP